MLFKKQFQITLQIKSWSREEERGIGRKKDENPIFNASDDLFRLPQVMQTGLPRSLHSK